MTQIHSIKLRTHPQRINLTLLFLLSKIKFTFRDFKKQPISNNNITKSVSNQPNDSPSKSSLKNTNQVVLEKKKVNVEIDRKLKENLDITNKDNVSIDNRLNDSKKKQNNDLFTTQKSVFNNSNKGNNQRILNVYFSKYSNFSGG